VVKKFQGKKKILRKLTKNIKSHFSFWHHQDTKKKKRKKECWWAVLLWFDKFCHFWTKKLGTFWERCSLSNYLGNTRFFVSSPFLSIVVPELPFSLSRALHSFVCLPIFLPSLLVFRSCLLCLCFLCLSLSLSLSFFTPFVCLLFADLISFLTTLSLDFPPLLVFHNLPSWSFMV
jgi:hypothetical protein